jgi:restriction system protein
MAGTSRRPTWQQQEAQRRRWEEQEQKRQAREAAERQRQAVKQQKEDELNRQLALAADRTAEVARTVAEITGILLAALGREWGPLDFEQLKRPAILTPLDLGVDREPLAAPRRADHVPAAPGLISRAFGGMSRYEQRRRHAEQAFERAMATFHHKETARLRRIDDATARHTAAGERAEQQAAAQHAEVDEFRREVFDGNRHAVSKYYDMILDAVTLPAGFPTARRAAYVPESTLLTIEWMLPTVSIVPTEREFQYVRTRNVIESRKPRTAADIRTIYQDVVAQLSLQALLVAFHADPANLVDTVVFNGMVDEIDPATGQPVRPCLITLRATREHFDKVNLRQAKPVACVRKHFAAEVSDHPEALSPVEPFLSFDMADPRIVAATDIISGLNRHPNLMDLTPKQFEHFIQNLFDRLGFDTKLFRASGDGGIDCVAYDPTPIRGGKYVIQVKQYTNTVPPTAVRDLFGTVHDQGATKGILITTSGFGPSSHEFANGKPLQLYDGTKLLWLCQQNGIDAQIVMPPRSKRAP